MSQKEMIIAKLMVRVSVFIAITGVFLEMNFNDVVIVFVKRNDCRIIYRM